MPPRGRQRNPPGAVIGVVVQPKTKQPVYVCREAKLERTAQIWATSPGHGHALILQGTGYLAPEDDDPTYLAAVRATGLPRAHTPDGVVNAGLGYGTCLYTGLVLLATAGADGQIDLGAVAGEGEGVCSDAESRSLSATRWWRSAAAKGLTQTRTETVPCETEDCSRTEQEEGVDLTSEYGHSAVKRAVQDAYPEVTYVNELNVDLERQVDEEEKEIEVDLYTLDRAEAKSLVACIDVVVGELETWWASAQLSNEGAWVDPRVILALNVAHESPEAVTRLAMLAKHAGASAADIEGMILRNQHGLDLEQRLALGLPPPAPLLPPPPPRGHTRLRHNPPALERELDKVLRRRGDLGWAQLEDLP